MIVVTVATDAIIVITTGLCWKHLSIKCICNEDKNDAEKCLKRQTRESTRFGTVYLCVIQNQRKNLPTSKALILYFPNIQTDKTLRQAARNNTHTHTRTLYTFTQCIYINRLENPSDPIA